MTITSREILLTKRPVGMPDMETFQFSETEIGDPAAGEVLVRNIWMSVDPYMRGRMYDRKSYIEPFEVGKALEGGAVGQVIKSNSDQLAVGDYVNSMLGWREYFTAPAEDLEKIDASVAPIQTYLGIMGMPGLTAYVGLNRIGEMKAGDNVFVSAASGAVGGMVCQIAKLSGCRVVGSVGSDEKAQWLTDEIGVDAAINYKTCGDLSAAVGVACPDGIDLYYENVGGAHLQAALDHMNTFGRIAICGMIADYNLTAPPVGPTNLRNILARSLRVQGFIVFNHYDMRPDYYAQMGAWIRDGKIKWKETVVDGLDKAPDAFLALFKGENFGKMLVKIGPDPAV